MSDVFVARQPIFDLRRRVRGYELLFRAGQASGAVIGHPERATAAVLLNSFTEIGLQQIVGSKTAWVNVSREFLLSGLAGAIPPRLVLLEILEDQSIDGRLIDAIAALKRQGYRFALDDFQHTPEIEPLLSLVDVVKLDFLALGRESFAREVERLTPYGITLLAEKVETHEDYDYCAHSGCELFQGYFFCRPELLRSRQLDANRLSLLNLLAALHDPHVELGALERTISRDVALSYRLLGYINSAFFGLMHEVRSIGQALSLLGVENLRRWAALSVFASVDDKPAELTVTALIRARFCELAGHASLTTASQGELFTLGLFSVIDALMDVPMHDALQKTPFPEDVRDALISHQGPAGGLLDCVTAIEAGAFDHAQTIIPNAGELYLAALRWADQAAAPHFAEPDLAAA